jgi:YD repeat-containing protein
MPLVPGPEYVSIVGESNWVHPTWQYQYDHYGRQTAMIDAKGRATTNTFDPLGNPITTRLPLGQTASNFFNLLG